MSGTWSWRDVATAFFGIVQWTIAIAAVLGTLGLFTWILVMFVKSDKAK
jgi:hypothetical protein